MVAARLNNYCDIEDIFVLRDMTGRKIVREDLRPCPTPIWLGVFDLCVFISAEFTVPHPAESIAHYYSRKVLEFLDRQVVGVL